MSTYPFIYSTPITGQIKCQNLNKLSKFEDEKMLRYDVEKSKYGTIVTGFSSL